MSTLGAMLVAIMVGGMLLTYHIGYTVGRREGWAQGRSEGKREGAVRAYAVGYDRGRHERQAKQSEAADSTPSAGGGWLRGSILWFLPLFVALLAIVLAAVSGSIKIHQ
jgi:hypothetical protein